jgi:hypothetical protein
MAQKPEGPELDPAIAARMFPERSTDEVVADIVSANPDKHGLSLSTRIAMAKSAAIKRGSAFDEEEAFYRACVTELAGGDPDAMLPGNKPRYTVEEDGTTKDHETGQVYRLSAPQGLEAPSREGQTTGDKPDTIAGAPADAEG